MIIIRTMYNARNIERIAFPVTLIFILGTYICIFFLQLYKNIFLLRHGTNTISIKPIKFLYFYLFLTHKERSRLIPHRFEWNFIDLKNRQK